MHYFETRNSFVGVLACGSSFITYSTGRYTAAHRHGKELRRGSPESWPLHPSHRIIRNLRSIKCIHSLNLRIVPRDPAIFRSGLLEAREDTEICGHIHVIDGVNAGYVKV